MMPGTAARPGLPGEEGAMPEMLALRHMLPLIIVLVVMGGLAGYMIWYLFVKLGK